MEVGRGAWPYPRRWGQPVFSKPPFNLSDAQFDRELRSWVASCIRADQAAELRGEQPAVERPVRLPGALALARARSREVGV